MMRTFTEKGLTTLIAAASVSLAAGAPAHAGTASLSYQTGEHKIAIPPGVTKLTVVATGGKGGNGVTFAWKRPLLCLEQYR
jgi:hypothetical protein